MSLYDYIEILQSGLLIYRWHFSFVEGIPNERLHSIHLFINLLIYLFIHSFIYLYRKTSFATKTTNMTKRVPTVGTVSSWWANSLILSKSPVQRLYIVYSRTSKTPTRNNSHSPLTRTKFPFQCSKFHLNLRTMTRIPRQIELFFVSLQSSSYRGSIVVDFVYGLCIFIYY